MPCSGTSDEVCGAGDRLTVFTNGNAAPAVAQQSGNYVSLGCYSDKVGARTLTTQMFLSGNVRVSDCTTACNNGGYAYAGLEVGQECWCGSMISNGAAPTGSSSCNMACTADASGLCGGHDALNVYKSTTIPASNNPGGSPVGQLSAGFSSIGCYSDSVYGRALSTEIDLDSNTIENCVSSCAGQGFSIAGVEYGSQCFCGSTIDNGNTPSSSGCDMACTGNKNEICGGAARK